MKGILKWLSGVLASAAVLLLVIVLTPYAAGFADVLLPDFSGSQISNAAILSQHLEESSRLETMQVTSEGVISSNINALIIGTVSTVNISYEYTGSYGIDLSKVQLQVRGSKLTFILPEPEVISDNITVLEIYRDGMLDRAVRLDDEDVQELLEKEREKNREQNLTGENAQALRISAEKALRDTVGVWLSQTNSRLEYSFQWAEPQAQ